MNDYQNYLSSLIQQPLEIKMKSLIAELRQLSDENRALLDYFKGVNREVENLLENPQLTVEDLSAFISKFKELLPRLEHLKGNLNELNQYRTISSSLKQTIENIGDFCMNNLSLDEILKASEGTENLKQQADEQKTAYEQLQTAYMVNESLIGFFAGVDKQFKNLMKYENINTGTVNTFTGLFEQYAEVLAGLKFQVSRINSRVLDQSSELQQLVQYCRQEMTLQEAGHCREELGKVQQEEQQRMAKEELERQEQLKQQEILRKQEEERKRQEEIKEQQELKRKEEERKQREGWLISNNDSTVTDPKTGLMWAAEDNGNDIDWNDAEKYCKSYRGGGYTNWRMPTMNELQRLFKSGSGYNAASGHPVYITVLIRLTSFAVWSSETSGSSASSFLFGTGRRYRDRQSGSSTLRALPVRESSK